jgi:glucose-6-phosphate isomerase
MPETLRVRGTSFSMDGTQLLEDGEIMDFTARTLAEMKDVLLDPLAASGEAGSRQIYFMYRDAGVAKVKEAFRKEKVRHDITVIPSMAYGGEFNKTLGHYHPEAEPGLSYPELYEVFLGEALFLLQKRLPEDGLELLLVSAKAGDRIIVPPNYGHIMVNTGRGTLVTANLVNSEFKSDYGPIGQKRGGAVYAMADGKMVLNRNYRRLSISEPSLPDTGFLDGFPSIYDAFVADPERFGFLARPGELGLPREGTNPK